MKKKLFPTVFGMIFFAAGFGIFIWMGARPAIEWQGMKNWDETTAHLVSAELSSSTDSDGGTTYRAKAEYQYEYGGRRYSGDRVAVFDMSDNIGSFQEDLGRKLERAYKKNKAVPVYVNPSDPGEAVLNRDMRWGMLGFVSIFGVVFCGAGGGFIYFVWRGSSGKRAQEGDPVLQDKPWLANAKWQSPTILSDAKFGMKMMWVFAVIWNAMTCYLPFIAYQEVVEKHNNVAVIALIFNIVGLGLIYAAIKATREWRRFGTAPLTLDPFPGAIGGHAGGYVDVKLPYDPSMRFEITLTNIAGSYSRSGSERRYREKAKWQDSLYAHTEAGPEGTRVFFQFKIPEGMNESDAESLTSMHEERHIWRLGLHADLPGADFIRQYDIPVYDTEHKTSRSLPERELGMMQNKNAEILDAAVKETIPLRFGASGAELFYPAGRNIGLGFSLICIGAIFAGGGVFALIHAGSYFLSGIFMLVGSLIVIGGLYTFGNSLLVTTDGVYLKTVRRVFGIPVKRRQLRIDLIENIIKHSSFQSQQGTKITMSYEIRAIGNQGEKLTIAEGLKGASKTDVALKYIAQQLNL
ncbi:MAG: DUF3592 domain-containing protein [Pseudomonadota bacterium]|nr:DUF3592 domain-containing protein [Pseudomonadota bacterium]QKK05884.1 MAG: DUF3592 domain-containing protein [Pseudomonadota bacterium]